MSNITEPTNPLMSEQYIKGVAVTERNYMILHKIKTNFLKDIHFEEDEYLDHNLQEILIEELKGQQASRRNLEGLVDLVDAYVGESPYLKWELSRLLSDRGLVF